MTFGEHLKEMRKRQGLTAEEVAERIGVTRQAYGRYEKYEDMPKPSTMKRLAKALDLPEWELSIVQEIGWISVKEEAPPYKCIVCEANGAVHTVNGIITVSYENGDRLHFDANLWEIQRTLASNNPEISVFIKENSIEAWMPIPSPYKGVTQ